MGGLQSFYKNETKKIKAGVVAHTCNLSIQEAEA